MGTGGLSELEIKEIEQTLQAKGFDPGTVDGVLDKQTAAVIRAFQKANNLQETGRIDQATADKLGVSLGKSGAMKRGGDASEGTPRSIEGQRDRRRTFNKGDPKRRYV